MRILAIPCNEIGVVMSSDQVIEKVWYNQKELSEYLGVSQSTIWRWIRDSRFPKPSMRYRSRGKYMGGRYNIRLVEAFMRHKIR